MTHKKFDVIIQNPPYHQIDGGFGPSAMPLYNRFVYKSISLNPDHYVSVIPSRWMTGGKGLDGFRNDMLNDHRFRILHDFHTSKQFFPTVEIKGGICYFRWDADYHGDCLVTEYYPNNTSTSMSRPLLENNNDIFIRYNEAISIYHKIQHLNEPMVSDFVLSRNPFGIPSNFKNYKSTEFENSIKLYLNQKIGYISKDDVIRNLSLVNKFKVLTPKAMGTGNGCRDKLKPIITEPNSCCTDTYLVMGYFDDIVSAKNYISFINTKFFHFLLSMRKFTQNTSKNVYAYIPMQSISKPWTDDELYEKYNISTDEIFFINSVIP